MRQNEETKIKRRKIAIALMEYVVVLGCLITLFVMLTPKDRITKTANSYAKPEEVTKYILSDEYISRIRPLTEYDTFKEIAENTLNENYGDKYIVKVYSDAEKTTEITQGYITTGMIVEYSLEEQDIEENNLENQETKENTIDEIQNEQQEEENKETIELIASVIGDTTKDGDCNIIELTQIIRHIIGIDRFKDQIEELSSDFNNDGQINVVDVSMCINYIVYGTIKSDKLVPNTPTIKTQGEGNINQNWYNSDVNVIITENEREEGEINKTQTTVEIKLPETDKTKTETTTEKEFGLSKEGNYKISSQNYGNNGTKSGIETKEINIDKTVPQITNLEEEKIDTSISNIFVKANDNTGIVKYKLIKDEEEKIVREIQITKNFEERIEIKENGLYKIIVEDIAGNTQEQEIEVIGLKNIFTIKFVNDDGTQLSIQSYRKGEEIEVIKNPTKRGNETYTYEFAGWEPEISRTAIKDEIYTATYQQIYKEYSVKFIDDIGNILSEKTDYHYGDTVQIPEEDFSKEDDMYVYEFVGWNLEIDREVTKNSTYKAVYNKIPKEYTIRFLNEDGTEIIEERTFKSTDKLVEDEPIPPHRDGYIGKWEEYTLRPENIEVRVYYEEVAEEGETVFFTDSNGITWRFVNENGYATNICYYSGNTNEELIEVPYSLNGYIAKTIAERFLGNVHNIIYGVKLPKTLEAINDNAFNRITSLKNIDIPNNVTSIGASAFKECTHLESINIPDGVVTIKESAFYECTKLANIELPNSITEIGSSAFFRCQNLECINIPNNLTVISKNMFEQCYKLDNIEIPDSVNNIKMNAFVSCNALSNLKLGNNLETIEIGAFSNCSSLTKIEIPSSVTNIGWAIFSGCNRLEDIYINNYEENITLPDNWNIGCNAYVHFIDCKHYITNNVDSDDMRIEVLAEEVLEDWQVDCGERLRFRLINNNEETILNKKLMVTSDGDFTNSERIREIIEPDNEGIFTIKNINRNKEINPFDNIDNWENFIAEDENGIKWNYTYYNGKAIDVYYESGEIGENLIIPAKLSGYPVRNINRDDKNNSLNIFGIHYSNASNYNISVINISEGIEGIDSSAFAGLSKLKTVFIPNSVTYIEKYSFYNCESLTDIYIDNEKPDIYLGNDWNQFAYAHFRECKHDINIEKYTNAYTSIENISDNVEEGKINCHDTYKFRLLNRDGEVVTSQRVAVVFDGINIEYKDYERVRSTLENASYTFENSEEGLLELMPDEEGCYEIQNVHRNLRIMIGSYQAKDSNGITWNYSLEDGKATNVYYEEGELSSVVQIPYSLNGYPVVSIENKEGPSNIFKKADNRKIIRKIKIPENVTSIGRYAFFNMNEIERIEIPNNLEKIGYAAFFGCKNITIFNIPDTLQEIDDWAFCSCEGLNEIRIPEKVTKIGNSTFANCKGLKNIEILGNIEEIGDNAFIVCDNLEYINIPNTVKRIGNAAFNKCFKLREIEVPESVEEIGSFAFYIFDINNIYIKNLEENIQLDSNWDEIVRDKVHFADCKHNIDTKIYSEGLRVESVTNNIEDNKIRCRDTYKFRVIDENTGEIIINKDVRVQRNNQDEEQIYPDAQGIYTIESINRDISIKINNSDKYQTATDTNRITWEYTYEDGNAVNVRYLSGELGETVRIPDTLNGYPVTQIENTRNDSFNIFNSAYWNSNKQQINYIELPETLISIGKNAFGGCSGLVNIELLNVTSIGNRAFSGCSSLAEIELPNVTSIENYAFYGCSSLESIEIPNATSIGGNAFSGCNSLERIEMSNATSIGGYAFRGCSNLANIDIPNVTSIGYDAFLGCSSLANIELPNVTSIEGYAFSGCSSLERIELPNVTSIGENAFDGCSSLASIELPNVRSIGEYAFKGCNNLSSIVIWQNVEELGERTFDNWTNNQSIYIEAEKQPRDWSKKWNYGCSAEIVYAYTGD